MRARVVRALLVVLATSSVTGPARGDVAEAPRPAESTSARNVDATSSRRVVYLDDGEKVARDASHELAPSVWPGAIELFALAGETIAFQAVVDVGPEAVARARARLLAFVEPLDAKVETFAERFVTIARPSGNEKEPGSLAFTPHAGFEASGARSFVGAFADALVPDTDATALALQRAAIWVDVTIPPNAPAGTYRTAIEVTDGDRVLDRRVVSLRVVGERLDYDNRSVTVYYDEATLAKRMDDVVREDAERELRQLLHAHRLSAIHEVKSPAAMEIDDEALDGRLYREARGYRGPGEGVGEGIFAIGAYGALGDASFEKAELVSGFAKRLRDANVFEATDTFLYAIDEDCASKRARAWRDQLAFVPTAKGVRVGVTCGDDPMEQAADLVLMTADRYDPDLAAAARAKGKKVWAYNGQRPYAGPMMLDVPAIDLRANAWIAARYDVERWFYWESTFWLDGNRGGRGGADGFDPFTVAETFHNESGDYANGDGILVYPGTQRPPMTNVYERPRRVDEKRALLLPSVRLKNLRRGLEDLGWVRLARARDPDGTDEVVRSIVPRALHEMKDEPATWPERGAAWLDARRRLLAIVEGPSKPAAHKPKASALSGRERGCAGVTSVGALFALLVLVVRWLALKSRRKRPS